MSNIDVSSESSSEVPEVPTEELKLEVVVVPVSDVDRAKRFYQEMLGWRWLLQETRHAFRDGERWTSSVWPLSPSA